MRMSQSVYKFNRVANQAREVCVWGGGGLSSPQRESARWGCQRPGHVRV
jgi:hypothetical protein